MPTSMFAPVPAKTGGKSTSGELLRRGDFGMQSADAASATAEVQMAYMYAANVPRNEDVAREAILKECQKLSLAEEAEYSKPVGDKKITGLSIRAAECAARHWKNIRTTDCVIYDDERSMKVRVSATDLQGNMSYSSEITINKVIERRSPGRGQIVIGERENSDGIPVYVVIATEEEMRNKKNAAVSRELRNHILRLIPADIKEEMSRTVRATKLAGAKADPDKAKRMLLAAFQTIGVSVSMLEKYLGHTFAEISLDEMGDLKGVGAAMRDGETTWTAVMESKAMGEEQAEEDAKDPAKVAAKARTGRPRRGRKPEPTPATPPAEEPPATNAGPATDEEPVKEEPKKEVIEPELERKPGNPNNQTVQQFKPDPFYDDEPLPDQFL